MQINETIKYTWGGGMYAWADGKAGNRNEVKGHVHI